MQVTTSWTSRRAGVWYSTSVAATSGRPARAACSRRHASWRRSSARRCRLTSAYSRSPNASRSRATSAAGTAPRTSMLRSPPQSATSPSACRHSSGQVTRDSPFGRRSRPAVISRQRLAYPVRFAASRTQVDSAGGWSGPAAAAGSATVTSEPTMRRTPSSRAFTCARTTPWTPSRSVRASAGNPNASACSTSSSGWLAPSRNEKLLLHQSGTYGSAIGPIRPAPASASTGAGGRSRSTACRRRAARRSSTRDAPPPATIPRTPRAARQAS